MKTPAHDVQVLVVEDNPLVRDLICKAIEPFCTVIPAIDGADGLVKSIDHPPDLIISDFRMPGLDGRQLHERLQARENTRGIPFVFLASKGDIEEKLRPAVAGAEDFLAKPFFAADLVRLAKKIVDRLHLEKMQKRAPRQGVIQGRLEEMSVTELMQSLEMGQKSCRLSLRRDSRQCELYFTAGQCKHAELGETQGDSAVYEAVGWIDGEFEIDFTASSDRATTTHSTTGLLMEAMRLMDEADRTNVES